MTIPPGIKEAPQRIADFVRDLMPKMRHRLSKDEAQLGIYLRGNKPLMEALSRIIGERIEGRARVVEPTDPIVCKAIMARDGELRWLLGRLEFIHDAPATHADDADGEPPA